MGDSVWTGETRSKMPLAWHLCWQAAIGRQLFADPSQYAKVRARLIDAHKRPGRVLIDYVLLPTEIHVVSSIPDGDSAGRVARAVGNIVSRWVREMDPVRSPVFAGPYRAHPLDTADGLHRELRMLAWRPSLQGLCATPSHYRHAALRTALGLTPAYGFDSRPLLALFGPDVQSARRAMRSWIARPPTGQEARQWELTRGLALATGTVGPRPGMTRELRDAAAAAFVAAGGPYGIDGALRLLESWVVVRLGVRDVLDLHRSADATATRGRALVACLAVQYGLCSAASVARHFHRAKATLSEQMAACRARHSCQEILAASPTRILQEAQALHRPLR